ncbi:Repressor of filamentous growth-like protein [Elsinoe fawcettii]|nr:Repressor of filamentous growth-like protein [Elsinoe fawcettii]
MSNPEISKIIGELWRSEPEEEKNRWKSFAEEDKIQHAQKYPSYRYQPKRSNKTSHTEGSPGPWTEIQICPKCNGRKVAQPYPSAHLSQKSQEENLPVEASTLPKRSNTITLPPPKPSASTMPSTRYLPMQNLSLSSPSSVQYATPSREHFSEQILSPKRRRIDPLPHPPSGTPVRQTFPFPNNPHSSQPQHPPHAQQAQPHHNRCISLPPASDLLSGPAPGQGQRMPPPDLPRPQQVPPRLITRRTPPRSDLSLNLPPLQTALAPGPHTGPPPSSAAVRNFTAAHAAQLSHSSMGSAGPGGAAGGGGRGGDLVLVKHKIGTLRQLLLPLPLSTPSTTQDPQGEKDERAKRHTGGKEGGRGAIVAVEGDSPSAARELADWLGEAMRGQGDVTVVDGPRVPEKTVRVEEMLRVVSKWHERAREMVEVVTSPEGTKTRENDGEEEKEKGRRKGKERKDSKSSAGTDEMDVDIPQTEEEKSRLLVLRGYVLTATNLFAARIPLTGNYDPKGHWEWTACLWRGIVAQDVIVYVKDVEGKEGHDMSGCEVLDDGRLIVVRRCKGEVEKTGVDGVQAGALRRLGFEVGEWLRSFSG